MQMLGAEMKTFFLQTQNKVPEINYRAALKFQKWQNILREYQDILLECL